jgi:hypothetical protein
MGTDSSGGFINVTISNCSIVSPPRSKVIYGLQRGISGISFELVDGDRHREILHRIFGTTTFGVMAVHGFFLLSGYLIVMSWEQVPIEKVTDDISRQVVTGVNEMMARVVLKRGDLSTAFTLHTRPDEDLPKGVRCGALDESDLTITGEAQSPDFQLSQPGLFVTIGSTTNVYRSLGEAGRSWKRGDSDQRRMRCAAALGARWAS